MEVVMKSNLGVILALLGMAGVPALSACGSDARESTERSGTLTMNLIGTGGSGVRYRLRTADFVVNGPQNVNFSSEADPNAASIRRELRAGDYIIRLKNGWALERETGGVFAPVDAILLSPNPVGFTIHDQAVTPVVFRFRAGDDVIDLGNGVLDVSIDVEDGACPAGTITCAGVCVNPTSDPANCGACAVVCPGGLACVNGACLSSCGPGRADCDGDSFCEADLLSDRFNCGACGNICPAAAACLNGACTSCLSPLVQCAGTCTDVRSDPNNCGSCGAACPAGASCTNGVCAAGCAPGFADCDGVVGNGCEVNLSSDPLNCGTCGSVCMPVGTCVAGACTGAPCAPGRADCDGNAANGCETLLDANPLCGSRLGPSVNGDAPGASVITGVGEQSVRVRVIDSDLSFLVPRPLTVRFTLIPPGGVTYRLEAGCDGCTTSVTGNQVSLGWDDAAPFFPPSDRDVFVNVTYVSGAACAPWELRIEGGLGGPLTCPAL
jgi:hypothetical protein